MIKSIKVINTVLLLILAGTGYCQSEKDTTAMIKEFNKVMSFAVQPYLYYNTVTKMDAVPVLEGRDTTSINGVFYKNGTNLYYHNGQEEIYLEDSLLVQINDDRKTIVVSRMDMGSREKMNVMPLGNKKLQELFSKNYTMSQSMINSTTARMNFQTKQGMDGSGGMTTQIGLEYAPESHLPLSMEMEVRMQEPAGDEILAALRMEGIDESKLIQTIDNIKYIVRKQRVSIAFSGFDTSKEKAMQMPAWKTKLDYDEASGEFAGKGEYKEYEVTKTF